MNIDSNIAIICLTNNGKKLAGKIKTAIKDGDIYFIQNKRDNDSLENNDESIVKVVEDNIDMYLVRQRLKNFINQIFDKYEYIIFIMATGIVVRTIAPLINSKFSDPGILVIDEKGINIISLLSGHMGGANDMTLHISKLIGANPVITTATDVNEKSSLDMISKKLDGYMDNFRENVKNVNSMLVNNKKVGLYIDGDYDVDTRGFTIIDKFADLQQYYIRENNDNKTLESIVVITNKAKIFDENIEIDERQYKTKIIKLVPKDIVLGIGCRRNTESQVLNDSLLDFLSNYNIDIKSIREIGSIDVKQDEKAIIDLSLQLSVPFKTFCAKKISQVDHLYEKSEFVKKNVGVFSVAEPVAHILSEGNVIIEKHKYKGITFSLGRVKL